MPVCPTYLCTAAERQISHLTNSGAERSEPASVRTSSAKYRQMFVRRHRLCTPTLFLNVKCSMAFVCIYVGPFGISLPFTLTLMLCAQSAHSAQNERIFSRMFSKPKTHSRPPFAKNPSILRLSSACQTARCNRKTFPTTRRAFAIVMSRPAPL